MKRITVYLLTLILMLSLCPVAWAADDAAVTEVEVGIPIEEHPELFLTRSMPTRGEGKIAVFLIEFPDQKNNDPKVTREYIDNVYFGSGNGEYWDNEPGTSVAAFYEEQSYGKLKLSGQVFDWYTAKHERSYYNNRKAELVIEAAAHYAARGVDFSQFDGDGDGVIDAITFHFAGEYSSDSNDPWYSGTEYELGGKPFGEIGGLKFITMVQVAAGLKGNLANSMLTKVICHELGHTLGLHDLYGTVKQGMNPTYDIMSKNARTINPYSKLMLGWLDTVRVITGDATNIVLEQYNQHSSDSVVIVCNEFKGFFDEFFVVAYREYTKKKTVAVWHIDARLNEKGTAFKYNNFNYNPDPDGITDPHGKQGDSEAKPKYSPYAFIEELSADPEQDFLLKSMSPEEASFLGAAPIGPNSVPSTDTHDGAYTGIKIDNFTERNNVTTNNGGMKREYFVTFDVSFVKDNEAPTFITQESEMVFQESITLMLSESAYVGKSFNDIKVTDLDGNQLDATVKIAYHPRNRLKIEFKNNAYKQGYKLVFPENCLVDSSGNAIKLTTLTAKPLAYMFPLSESQVTPAGYIRNNAKAHFFTTDYGFDVLTFLWEFSPELQTNVGSTKLELMKFDRDGNELEQLVIDNPIENSDIELVFRTDEGDYLIFCSFKNDKTMNPDSIFCVDSKGKLKWKNEDFVGTETFFTNDNKSSKSDISGFSTNGDVVVKMTNGAVLIHMENGKISSFEYPFDYETPLFYGAGSGRVIFICKNNKQIDGKTYHLIRVLDSDTLETIAENVIDSNYDIKEVRANSSGTFLVYAEKTENGKKKSVMCCLDAALNMVNEISWEKDKSYNEYIHWLDNDGFFLVNIISSQNHSNGQYHVRRYNKLLELVWETDIEALFFRFFKNSTGDLICYRSMWEPERECYIDFYGSDRMNNPEHTHTIVYYKETVGNCANPSHGQFWQCADCGIMFSDEGKTIVLDASELFTLPMEHSYGEGKITVQPTCMTAGKESRQCTVCGEKVISNLPANKENHIFIITCIKESTCCEDGLNSALCKVCEKCEQQVVPASDKYHVEGEWKVVKEPTVSEEGEERMLCQVCGETMSSRKLAKLPSPEEETVVVQTEKETVVIQTEKETTGSVDNEPSQGGCGSSVGTGLAAVFIATLLFGAVSFVKKEK